MSLLRKYFTIITLFLCSLTYAASLSGYVSNTSELTLHYISNFLTGEKTVVAQSAVTAEGYYHFEFKSETIRTYYIDLGSRQAQIVISPEQDLTLDLPDYSPLRKAEYLNPYFEKGTILLYDDKKKDINYHLVKTERCAARQFKRILESPNPSYTSTSCIDSIIALTSDTTNFFLSEYNYYSQAFFYQMAHPKNTYAIKQQYMRLAQPNLQNTAFTKLFESEYHNPFLATDGRFYQNISDAILEEKITADIITNIGHIHKIKNRSMAELIAVKGFYDAALYAPNYQRIITQLMLQLEEQLLDPSISALCHSSRIKIEKLMVGSPAPYYELFTPKGKKVPTVLKRKNVLLAFINTNNLECQKQLYLLEKYKSTYKRHLEIVVIAVHQDRTELERFLTRNSFKDLYFTLWDNNEALLEDYNIKVLPSYYLIGKDGNFIYAPLSSPEETMIEELQEGLGF